MNTLDFDLDLQLREEAQEGYLATLYGRAMPYDTATTVGGRREQFAQGAFDPKDVIGKPLAWRHGDPIGVITAAHNAPDGLYITAGIVDTVQGRDANLLLRSGAIKGLSAGFIPKASTWLDRARSSVKHTAATLFEVSLTHMPAYATAGVSAVREGVPMSETTVEETAPVVSTIDLEAREAITQVREQFADLAASVHVAPEAHPLAQFRSLGEYHRAVLDGEIESRAVIDQITSDNPGVMPPSWSTMVHGIIARRRAAINAFGVESAGDSGMDFNWPYYDGDLSAIVAEQATQKTEVNSVKISLKKGSTSLKTYAAVSDIAFQLLQRSAPSYLDAHNRIFLAAYAITSDNAFADALVAGGTASAADYDIAADTDGSKLRAALFQASVEVEAATGAPAEFVLVATDVFLKIGGMTALQPEPYGTQNVPGVATASTLRVNVNGLPVIHESNLAAGSIIASNSDAASWIEDGPRLIDAPAVSKLGQDVAVYGFGTPAIYLPKGVVKVTNLP